MANKLEMGEWTKDAINMARSSFEMGTKNFDRIQNQTKKSIDFALQAAGQMQEQTQKVIGDWQKTVEDAGQSYAAAIESGWNSISSAINNSMIPLQTKPSKDDK